MKILQIGKFRFDKKGGIEKVTQQLCKGLSESGHDVTFLCSGEDNKKLKCRMENIAVRNYGSWFSLRSAPFSPGMLFYLYRHRKDFDVIHVHLPNPFVTLFMLLTKPAGAIIAHWHSDVIKQKILLKIYHPVLMKFLKMTARIIATSPNYIEGSDYLQIFREKVDIIPLGMAEMDKPSQSEIDAWQEKFEGKKIVLSIGRLVYYKSFDVLIKAAGLLPDDYHVVIIGCGEEEEPLKKDIERYAKGRVTILDVPDNKAKNALLAACSVFVLSSSYKSEAYGLVQVEAMQFGKPIVSCAIKESGVSFVNMDGESGLIVDVGDHKAIAEAVERICTEDGLYEKLSTGARSRYEEMFQLIDMINKVEKLYNESK